VDDHTFTRREDMAGNSGGTKPVSSPPRPTVRSFLQEYNRRTGATILLTSHYMADVTALCERIIIIHHGRLKYDGSLTELSRKIAPYKLIGVALGEVFDCDLGCAGRGLGGHRPADRDG
jgi:hypothetical protein